MKNEFNGTRKSLENMTNKKMRETTEILAGRVPEGWTGYYLEKFATLTFWHRREGSKMPRMALTVMFHLRDGRILEAYAPKMTALVAATILKGMRDRVGVRVLAAAVKVTDGIEERVETEGMIRLANRKPRFGIPPTKRRGRR